jgi:hypothetical protein
MDKDFISLIDVNLTSQKMHIIWNEGKKEGPFHISHGKGKKGFNCKIEKTSKTQNTNCTPIGKWEVLGHRRRFTKYRNAEYVTLFQSLRRGIAIHYWPNVPIFPASHGCIRVLRKDIAERIYKNTKVKKSIVKVYY